jgi:hypothetical protein
LDERNNVRVEIKLIITKAIRIAMEVDRERERQRE